MIESTLKPTVGKARNRVNVNQIKLYMGNKVKKQDPDHTADDVIFYH
jgi:hypothetical protein